MLADRTSASARIVVVAQSPIRAVPPFDNLFGRVANSHATTLNAITRELCEAQPKVDTSPCRPRQPLRRTASAPLSATDLRPFHCPAARSPLNDEAWPTAQKTGSSARNDRNRPQNDEDRYRSLEQLGIIDGGPDARIDHIVATARASSAHEVPPSLSSGEIGNGTSPSRDSTSPSCRSNSRCAR